MDTNIIQFRLADANLETRHSITQVMRAERNHLKPHFLNFIRHNPACTEEEALGEWQVIVLGGRPRDRNFGLQSARGLLLEYRANLAANGHISIQTWEAHRTWLLRKGRIHRTNIGESPWHSALDEALIDERKYLKSQIIPFIKRNRDCTEAEVLREWEAVAPGGRPENRPWPLVSNLGLLLEYRANLFTYGQIPVPSWEAQRTWIQSTF